MEKTFLVLISLVIVGGCASPSVDSESAVKTEPNVESENQDTSGDVCTEFSLIAKEIMTARQDDKPMSATLPIAIARIEGLVESLGVEVDDDAAGEYQTGALGMVTDAYDRPVWSSESLRRQEISDFENRVFVECYKAMMLTDDDQ